MQSSLFRVMPRSRQVAELSWIVLVSAALDREARSPPSTESPVAAAVTPATAAAAPLAQPAEAPMVPTSFLRSPAALAERATAAPQTVLAAQAAESCS